MNVINESANRKKVERSEGGIDNEAQPVVGSFNSIIRRRRGQRVSDGLTGIVSGIESKYQMKIRNGYTIGCCFCSEQNVTRVTADYCETTADYCDARVKHANSP